MNKTVESSRTNLKKSKKRRGCLRRILVILAVLLVIGGALGYFAYQRFQPSNYFKNLKAIGNHDNYTEKSGTFNVLLIGSDARHGETASHTDSMVLIHVDLNNHTYNMLSIPRDTRVQMKDGRYTKLTSVQFASQTKNGTKQGIIDAVSAVSTLTGVPINYYAETNYWGLQYMVDAIGGINVKLPFKVTLTHPWYDENLGKTFAAGTHHLNGGLVTELCHERYSLPGTDYGRQKVQQAALMGIANKMMQPENATRLPQLSRSLSKFLVATNMTTEDMISMGLAIKKDFHPEKQIKYRQIKGRSVTMYDDLQNAEDSQIILNSDELKSTIDKYFTN